MRQNHRHLQLLDLANQPAYHLVKQAGASEVLGIDVENAVALLSGAQHGGGVGSTLDTPGSHDAFGSLETRQPNTLVSSLDFSVVGGRPAAQI